MNLEARALKSLCLSFTLLFLATVASGQGKNLKVFNPVPKELRPALAERLNLFIEYKKAGKNDWLYDLFSDDYNSSNHQWKNKEEYIKFQQELERLGRRPRLISFTPTHTRKCRDKRKSQCYEIWGILVQQAGGETTKQEYYTRAQLKDGVWYFSTFYWDEECC